LVNIIEAVIVIDTVPLRCVDLQLG